MNTNRVFARSAERFGLVAMVESRRVVLPLKGVECEFSIQAGIVEVVMTQIFRQENPKPLDCDYVFPLPADASVYACEADINGRIICAKVRERNEAVMLAMEKKAEGRRVVLVESERDNLFTLGLSNLQPNDLVLVKLKYIQPLRSLADMPSVEIPFCPGVRYIPGNPLVRSNRGRGTVDDTDQVPDASRISPVRMDKEHPDAAYIEIRGTLDANYIDAASLVSPSHNIISRPEADRLLIRLSDTDEVPDRDFVLRWRENKPETIASSAWVHDRGGEAYALLEIRAPKATAEAASPMDFYFLVDRSGSMAGVKWQKAALAVQSCVKALGEKDRAMITFFESGINDFAEEPLPPRQIIADTNFQNLEQMLVGGGTELGGALRHMVEISAIHSVQRQKSLILITDAQVGNESGILKIMEGAMDFPVHCFGIDIALNDALLIALARQQRGTFHSLNPADDVARAVTDLALAIRHPVLQELQLSGGWETAEAWIPPLYSGQIYYFSARSATKAALALTGRNGSEKVVPIPLASRSASGNVPYLHWCKHRIQRCVTEGRKPEAVALSVESNLICTLTAFIAWDESEKVAVANHLLAQPVFDGETAACAPMPGSMGRAGSLTTSFLSSTTAHFMSREKFAEAPKQMQRLEALPVTPSDPAELVRKIAHPSRLFHLFTPRGPGPFTVEERMAAFKPLFDQICRACLHPDCKPMCDRILQWTMADDAEALNRSHFVAKLLADLLKPLAELQALRTRMAGQAGEKETEAASIAQLERNIREKLSNFAANLK